MRSRRTLQPDLRALSVAVLGWLTLSGCQTTSGSRLEPASYRIDPSVQPEPETIPGRAGQPARPVGVVVHPNGMRERFIENEIVLKPRDEEHLNAFLAKYNGVVVDDGRPSPPPAQMPEFFRNPPEPSGYYTIRIDPATVRVAGFSSALSALGLGGELLFSSEDAAKSFAIAAQEKRAGAVLQINHVLDPGDAQCVLDSTREHPADPSAPNPSLPNDGYTDAFSRAWLNDTDLQVTRAWQFLELLGREKATVPVAIVDRGFQRNQDFHGFPNIWGYDFEDGDYHGGVESNESNFHGTGSFAALGAVHDNQFGVAGTGGQVVVPLFFRALTAASTANAIHNAAVNWGAEVVSISQGSYMALSDILNDALKNANNNDVVVVALAHNQERDLDKTEQQPCEGPFVIGVGAIVESTKRAVRKGVGGSTWGSNYGSNVDIWGVGDGFASTPTPTSGTNLSFFNGTSAATPYVAGIVAMMKAVSPSLNHDKAVEILQKTANASSDPRVASGYVNAVEALKETASFYGVKPAGDSFEPNDDIYDAALIATGSTHTATIAPGDEDLFECVLDDYRDVTIAVEYQFIPTGREIRFEVFDGYRKPVPSALSTTDDGEARTRTRRVTGVLTRRYFVRVYGSTASTINCYRLRVEPGVVNTIAPDRFDDQIPAGESRNDSFASRAVIPGVVESGVSPKMTIDDLNFHVAGDKDFFEVQLAPAVDPSSSQTECLAPGTPPHGEAGFYQGKFRISIFVARHGIREPFSIELYDSAGAVVTTPVTRSEMTLEIGCPHRTFSDGRVRFSVASPSNRRNFYQVSLHYSRWFALLDVPEIFEDQIPVFRFPPIPELVRTGIDPWVYPATPQLIDDSLNPEIPEARLRDHAVLVWDEAGDLDLTLTTMEGNYLEVTLFDVEGRLIGGTATTRSQDLEESSARSARLVIPNLPAGTYRLSFGSGDFQTPFQVDVRQP